MLGPRTPPHCSGATPVKGSRRPPSPKWNSPSSLTSDTLQLLRFVQRDVERLQLQADERDTAMSTLKGAVAELANQVEGLGFLMECRHVEVQKGQSDRLEFVEQQVDALQKGFAAHMQHTLDQQHAITLAQQEVRKLAASVAKQNEDIKSQASSICPREVEDICQQLMQRRLSQMVDDTHFQLRREMQQHILHTDKEFAVQAEALRQQIAQSLRDLQGQLLSRLQGSQRRHDFSPFKELTSPTSLASANEITELRVAVAQQRQQAQEMAVQLQQLISDQRRTVFKFESQQQDCTAVSTEHRKQLEGLRQEMGKQRKQLLEMSELALWLQSVDGQRKEVMAELRGELQRLRSQVQRSATATDDILDSTARLESQKAEQQRHLTALEDKVRDLYSQLDGRSSTRGTFRPLQSAEVRQAAESWGCTTGLDHALSPCNCTAPISPMGNTFETSEAALSYTGANESDELTFESEAKQESKLVMDAILKTLEWYDSQLQQPQSPLGSLPSATAWKSTTPVVTPPAQNPFSGASSMSIKQNAMQQATSAATPAHALEHYVPVPVPAPVPPPTAPASRSPEAIFSSTSQGKQDDSSSKPSNPVQNTESQPAQRRNPFSSPLPSKKESSFASWIGADKQSSGWLGRKEEAVKVTPSAWERLLDSQGAQNMSPDKSMGNRGHVEQKDLRPSGTESPREAIDTPAEHQAAKDESHHSGARCAEWVMETTLISDRWKGEAVRAPLCLPSRPLAENTNGGASARSEDQSSANDSDTESASASPTSDKKVDSVNPIELRSLEPNAKGGMQQCQVPLASHISDSSTASDTPSDADVTRIEDIVVNERTEPNPPPQAAEEESTESRWEKERKAAAMRVAKWRALELAEAKETRKKERARSSSGSSAHGSSRSSSSSSASSSNQSSGSRHSRQSSHPQCFILDQSSPLPSQPLQPLAPPPPPPPPLPQPNAHAPQQLQPMDLHLHLQDSTSQENSESDDDEDLDLFFHDDARRVSNHSKTDIDGAGAPNLPDVELDAADPDRVCSIHSTASTETDRSLPLQNVSSPVVHQQHEESETLKIQNPKPDPVPPRPQTKKSPKQHRDNDSDLDDMSLTLSSCSAKTEGH